VNNNPLLHLGGVLVAAGTYALLSGMLHMGGSLAVLGLICVIGSDGGGP